MNTIIKRKAKRNNEITKKYKRNEQHNDKTGKSEYAEEYGESYDYALKRAIDGSTDSERRIQRNFALFGQALLDVPDKIKLDNLVKKIA